MFLTGKLRDDAVAGCLKLTTQLKAKIKPVNQIIFSSMEWLNKLLYILTGVTKDTKL